MAKTAIISVDGHVKAARTEYRDYLPKQYLERYDEQVKAAEEAEIPDAGNLHPGPRSGGAVGLGSPDREPRTHRCGRRGAVPQRSAVPAQPARRPSPRRQPRAGGSRPPGLQPLARRLLRTRRRSGAEARCRRRSSTSTEPSTTSTGPRSTASVGSCCPELTPREPVLRRPRARPDLGCVPGDGPADQRPRRRQPSRLRTGGFRRDGHGHGRERVLLEPIAVDAHLRRGVRPLPGPARVATSRRRRT